MKRLGAFTNKLWTSRTDEAKVFEPKATTLCELHSVANCESCRFQMKRKLLVKGDDGDEVWASEDEAEPVKEGWWKNQVRFEKDTKGKDLMRRRDNIDDYVVIDPRVKRAQQERLEKEKKALYNP